MSALARVIPLRRRRATAAPVVPAQPVDDLTALAAAAGVLSDRRPPCSPR